MFFNLHTLDPLGTSPWKRSTDTEQKATFEGQADLLAYLTSKLDPEAIQRGENDRPLSRRQSPARRADASALVERADMEVPKLLPDG